MPHNAIQYDIILYDNISQYASKHSPRKSHIAPHMIIGIFNIMYHIHELL